jgi:hypothetical protein
MRPLTYLYMNTPVRLLHIPKTAGTTISSSLVIAYGRKHAFSFSGSPSKDRKRLLEIDEETRRNITLYYGHSFYETGVEEADRASIITFLREPVSRVKSFIQHAGERKEKYLPEAAIDQPFTVNEFLDTGNYELANLQTKILTNLDDAEFEKLGENASFELARERLFQGLAAFGIQSRFDEGWVAIWMALERRPPVYVHLRRVAKAAMFELTPEQIERIKDLNRLDIRLYQAAEAEFERRVAGDPNHQKACKAFKMRQKLLGPTYSMAWNLAKKVKRALR